MWILTAVLIGLAGNLDNLGVGVAYGARRIGIPFLSNLLIALVATVGTGLLAYTGGSLKHLLSPAVAGAVSASCIIAVGFWVLWPRRAGKEPIEMVIHPEEADVDHSGDISPAKHSRCRLASGSMPGPEASAAASSVCLHGRSPLRPEASASRLCGLASGSVSTHWGTGWALGRTSWPACC